MKPKPTVPWPLLRRARLASLLVTGLVLCGGLPARAATFANQGPILIPLLGPAAPYPSAIPVANLPGEITSVNVTLLELIHPTPDDLDILLVGPGGQSVLLMSDAGGRNPVQGGILTFSDASTAVLPDTGRIVSGTYRPTNYGSGDVFPAPPPPLPAPPTAFGAALAVFNGRNPNGVWRLYVVDDLGNNAGTIGGGWRLEINTTNFPPVITKQPQDQSVLPGGTATFQIEAQGTPPLVYQWLHNGNVIVPFGQGSDTLTIPDVKTTDAGAYAVVVANATGAAGAVTSRNAQLTVLGPLTIQSASQSVVVPPGDTVVFDVKVSGTPPILYQWTCNGKTIPGETSSALVLRDVQPTNGGKFEVVVWNESEAVVSQPMVLRVRVPVEFLPDDKFAARPTSQSPTGVLQGDSSDFGLEPGERPLPGGGKSAWFQWFAPTDGVVTFTTRGSAFDTLLGVFTGESITSLRPVTRDDDGEECYTSQIQFNARAGTPYQIVIDGFGRSGSGGPFTITWGYGRDQRPVPVIIEPPASRAVEVGKSVTFRIQTESPNDTFIWLFNGKEIAGENQNSLTIPEARSQNVGVYRVGIRNALERIIFSPPFQLQVGAPGLKLVEDKFETMLLSSGSPGAGFLSIGLGNTFFNEVPSDASRESGDPTPCGSPFFGTLWQGLTATNNGVIQVETIGSSIPARLAVYRLTGSVSDFFSPPLICDLTSASNGIPAVARFNATNGTNYTVVVEGLGTGNLSLNTKMGVAPALSVPLKYCLVALNGGIVLSMPATNWCPLPSCQWRCNGTNMPNATNATLLVTNFHADRIGTYSVVVSNFVRATTVSVAYLDLAGPFTLGHSWVGSGGTLGFKLWSSNTAPFVLETTTSITGPWQPVATNPDPCFILFFTNGSPWLDPQRFFRASPWSPP